ncbi:VOC family protein [Serratia marcescens]|uniref:VOC family protein n=1 Tax=Serratia marcescens TaxID=615 RepID=UPI00298E61E5|nr:VOC family protein [Serratia marcescens]WPC46863.1 VOC family protein [Serratia marcescens]
MPPFSLKTIDHVVLRVRDAEKSLRFYTQTLGCDIAKRRPDLGLVHLRAGTAMIDLVDVNGQLGKKAATRPILTGKMSITSACASILSTKSSCWPICDRRGSPSILLNRATVRKATGHRFTSAIRTAIA